ncbi:MAG: triose-phosphate isomerase [Porticoccaceae bacterium]
MRKPLVIGNWKMNGSQRSVGQLLDGIAGVANLDVEVVVCPPFVYLAEAAARISGTGIRLGAQSLSEYECGAYTGEVAGSMLADVGCQYVLVGHSERRRLFGETDVRVARQFERARAAGIIPVLCVGEDAAERNAGATWQVLHRQLEAIADVAGWEALGKSVIAYEPVWAIGTGATASAAQVQDVQVRIRDLLGAGGAETRLLYGGSVSKTNAAELFARPDVDGVLVGGASLQAEEFMAICRLAVGESWKPW